MIETGLANKVVIVTGAAAGIGRATALRFAAEGARMAAWDVTSDGAEALIAEIEAGGGEGHFVAVDVSIRSRVDALSKVCGQNEEIGEAHRPVTVDVADQGRSRGLCSGGFD